MVVFFSVSMRVRVYLCIVVGCDITFCFWLFTSLLISFPSVVAVVALAELGYIKTYRLSESHANGGTHFTLHFQCVSVYVCWASWFFSISFTCATMLHKHIHIHRASIYFHIYKYLQVFSSPLEDSLLAWLFSSSPSSFSLVVLLLPFLLVFLTLLHTVQLSVCKYFWRFAFHLPWPLRSNLLASSFDSFRSEVTRLLSPFIFIKRSSSCASLSLCVILFSPNKHKYKCEFVQAQKALIPNDYYLLDACVRVCACVTKSKARWKWYLWE